MTWWQGLGLLVLCVLVAWLLSSLVMAIVFGAVTGPVVSRRTKK